MQFKLKLTLLLLKFKIIVIEKKVNINELVKLQTNSCNSIYILSDAYSNTTRSTT